MSDNGRAGQLPKCGLPIPTTRDAMLLLLTELEEHEGRQSGQVLAATAKVREAEAWRNECYNARQDTRQDIRVLRMKIRDTMPLQFDDDPKEVS